MKQKSKIKVIIAWCQVNPLYIILAVSLTLQFIITALVGVMEWTDSPTYYNAGTLLLRGEIDPFRTPTYPLFFAIIEFITGYQNLWIIAIIQVVLFYLSVVVFYKTCYRLHLSNSIIIVATCVYAFCPRLLYNNMMMMTESLAVSVSVFLIYFFLKWYQEMNWKSYIGILCTSLFLEFIRPSFLFLLIAIAVVALLFLINRHYKRAIELLACVAVSGMLLFGYSKIVESKTGIFTPSVVSTINELTIALNNGTLKSDRITNPDIKQRVLDFENKGVRKSMWDGPDFSGISIKELNDELSLLKGNKISWYVKTLKSNIIDFISAPVVSINEVNIFITFGELSVILAVIFLYLCIYLIRTKRIPIVAIFLWLICMGNLSVNLLGSYAEWARLFMPSLPILFILCAQICNKFIRFQYQKQVEVI